MTIATDERSELTQRFAKTANGYPLDAVINAGGNMIINALRQSNPKLEDAEKQLDDLVERMKAAIRENHYTENGSRKVHHIQVPLIKFNTEFLPL